MKAGIVVFLVIGACAVFACTGTSASTAVPTPTPTSTTAPVLTPTRPVELQVLPRTLRPGMRAMMVGVGFDKGERIAFYLIRPDGTKTSESELTADTTGGAAFQLDVMDDWQPGQYIARVQSKRNPLRRAEQRIELHRR